MYSSGSESIARGVVFTSGMGKVRSWYVSDKGQLSIILVYCRFCLKCTNLFIYVGKNGDCNSFKSSEVGMESVTIGLKCTRLSIKRVKTEARVKTVCVC